MKRHLLATRSFSSITNLKVLRAGEIIHFLTRKIKYPLILRDTLVVVHASTSRSGTSPLAYRQSHRHCISRFLSDTPAHERKRDSRNYADNRHNLSHSKVQFLPRSREKSSASFHYSRVVSHPISRPHDKWAPPMQAFTIYFEAFFRTNIMS